MSIRQKYKKIRSLNTRSFKAPGALDRQTHTENKHSYNNSLVRRSVRFHSFEERVLKIPLEWTISILKV